MRSAFTTTIRLRASPRKPTAGGSLESQLGDQYPPAMGGAMLGRAEIIGCRAREQAKKELLALVPRLGGDERTPRW